MRTKWPYNKNKLKEEVTWGQIPEEQGLERDALKGQKDRQTSGQFNNRKNEQKNK